MFIIMNKFGRSASPKTDNFESFELSNRNPKALVIACLFCAFMKLWNFFKAALHSTSFPFSRQDLRSHFDSIEYDKHCCIKIEM
jgi:hypothetical protein